MDWLRELCRRLCVLFRRGRFERDLEEEMQFHFELQAEENRENGMATEDADYAARRQFGNSELLKETSREAWGWSWLEGLGRDFGFALRLIRRSPLVAVLTIPAVCNLACLGAACGPGFIAISNDSALRRYSIRSPDLRSCRRLAGGFRVNR